MHGDGFPLNRKKDAVDALTAAVKHLPSVIPACSDSSSATGCRSGFLLSLAMAFWNPAYQRAAASGDCSAIHRNASMASVLAVSVTTMRYSPALLLGQELPHLGKHVFNWDDLSSPHVIDGRPECFHAFGSLG